MTPHDPAQPERLLSAKEVGQLLGKSAFWVLEECKAGRIEHTLVGKTRCFTPAQYQAYVESQRQPAIAAAPSGRRSRSRRRAS